MSNTTPKNPGDFRAYLASVAAECTARVDRVRHLIGDKHWLSAGEYHESIVRNLLRSHLPERFEVSTGFVRWHDTVISNQIDVLVWDRLRTAPLLRDGEFVILPSEGVVAAFEVKTTLTPTVLVEALDALHIEPWRSYSNLMHGAGSIDRRPIRALVAFRANPAMRSPAKVFSALAEYYRRMYEGSRSVMGMRLGIDRVSSRESSFGDFAEFFRPRFFNLVDAITIADRLHVEQVKVFGGAGKVDPAYVALSGEVNNQPLALAWLVLLMRDLLNRRQDDPGHSAWAMRRDSLQPLANPALGTFGGSVDPESVGLAADQIWRPQPPLW